MNLEAKNKAVVDAVERVAGAVVRIGGGAHGGTTGVWWSHDGLVITTVRGLPGEDHFVISGSDGREIEAELVGRDFATDLAVLRVADADASVPPFSDVDVQVGTLVVAVARPGRSARAVFGIIGVLGESFRGPTGASIDRWIQMDRDLPRGFTGSVLVDLEGHAIGIHSRGLVRGVTIAVPGSTIARVVDRIVRHGEVPRGYIGVAVHSARLPAAVADETGTREAVVVVGLEEGGPAARAGVMIGDVLLSVAGSVASSALELRALLQDRADETVNVRLLRGGEAREVEIETSRR